MKKTNNKQKKQQTKKEIKIRTNTESTWCPGCFNFQILAGSELFLKEQLKTNPNTNWAMVSGIGCHGKIFDYLNLPGLNALHGRGIPVALGMKIAQPDLNVLVYSGDGDAYAEGIEHLIHAARNNSNFKLIVHNNQVFALTVAQPTPVTEIGYSDKTTPNGVKLKPLNPIKLMLASGASFVARVFAEADEVKKILDEAHKHKGFAFIEVIQPCIIFHPDSNYKIRTYNLQEKGHDKTNFELAMKKAEEFDYDSPTAKIPVGIFYQKERRVFEENL